MARSMVDMPGKLPKTIDKNGNLETCNSSWWVSGFFPGQLWYLYEYSKNDSLKKWAELYTERVSDQQYTTNNHDVGFMIFCSFGNGYRITGNEKYLSVLKNAANSLSTRFNPTIGCIRSWDRAPWNNKWQYAVIIDNMMNLELLMWNSKKFKEPRFSYIAESHANTTLKNHFRPDGSSYHVVSYDTINGKPEIKQTAQGYSDESAWTRGQAWGLYGYTMMYRETGDSAYLQQAIKIANFIINHPNLPEDNIPYWDFNAPDIPNSKRDVSAGAIICSALIELQKYVDKKLSEKYMEVAEKQLRSLCSDAYLAAPGTNASFLLKHGVGNMPNGTEVDVPLSYADYYFVEAMVRYCSLKRYH
jgi:unsaturated chondroitin disaccharide hydrolase